MEKQKSRIWFITGISSGLGKALAEVVMQSGDFVVGTFRNARQVEEFNRQYDGKGLALQLDVTRTADISQAFDTLRQRFGRLDVLVNNAGFGFAGAIEEASLAEVRDVFEANFFGTLQVTQAALPLLRQQRGGQILQISSQSGFKAVPGFGIYNASKFALEGFSEALAAEVAPLGIRLTIVEPGPFRTDFANRSFRLAARVIDDYHETAGAFRQRMKDISGKQEGDPYKAAQAIVAIVAEENPPLRLPLGKLAVATLTAKLESVQRDLDAYRHIAENAVYT